MRTKRDLIKSVINTHDFKYILNIDYGKSTEREHYHCIISTNLNFNVNQFIQDSYPCHCLALPCKKGESDFKSLTKYLNKLLNHCLKATTKKQRLLYNFKGYDEPLLKFLNIGTQKYKEDYVTYFSSFEDEVRKVSLLDKADITGKNLTQTLQFDVLPIIDIMLTSIYNYFFEIFTLL